MRGCAFSIFGVGVTALSQRINGFLKRSHRYGFTNKILEVGLQQLLDSDMQDLFTKMQSPDHCSYPLLPSRKDSYITVRPRDHDYELPNCIYNLHKQSYIVNGLFKFFCDVFLMHCTCQICFLLVLYFYLVLYLFCAFFPREP